jgi:PAS domain S-box-containing protein/excisionase family DNA binding protein
MGGPRRELLTISEAAEFLRYHSSTLYRLVRQGALPAVKVGKEWRLDRQLLINWVRINSAVDQGSSPEAGRRAASESGAETETPAVASIDEIVDQDEPAVVIADQRGFITRVNAAFERIFGWSAGEIIGRPLSTIIPPNLRDSHHLGFSRFLTTGKPTLLNRPLTLTAVRKDGKQFESEHVIVAERRDGEWTFGATIRPGNLRQTR